MSEENKDIARLKKIEVLSFSLNPKPKDDSPNKLEYRVTLECTAKVNAEKKLLFIISVVNVLTKDNKYTMGSITVSVVFEIQNFSNYATLLKDNKYQIDSDLEKKLTLTSINTVRGVVMGYFRGSYLQNILVPLVDDDLLIRTDT